nr:IclR family transcriptional regulator C-terminal domain-containing protein [Devosia sp.]
MGSPVLDHTGSIVGALAVFAPTFRVPDDRVVKFAEMTRDAADELSVSMGYERGSQKSTSTWVARLSR